jgi:hypothetical protein
MGLESDVINPMTGDRRVSGPSTSTTVLQHRDGHQTGATKRWAFAVPERCRPSARTLRLPYQVKGMVLDDHLGLFPPRCIASAAAQQIILACRM